MAKKKKSKARTKTETVREQSETVVREHEVSDFGPDERWQHDEFAVERTGKGGGVSKRRRVTTQTPLDRYFSRGQITREQYDAGVRYFLLHRKGLGTARVTGKYEPFSSKSTGTESEGQGQAYVAFRECERQIGRQLADCAYDVLLMDMSAGDYAKKKNADPKGGILVFRLALDAIADHFGMPR